MTQPPVALRLVIAGRVQGVGFREACRRAAAKAGIAGWVRNLPDGRVEAWLEGEPGAVGRVGAWCQHGPSWAHVSGVEMHDVQPAGLTDFRITVA